MLQTFYKTVNIPILKWKNLERVNNRYRKKNWLIIKWILKCDAYLWKFCILERSDQLVPTPRKLSLADLNPQNTRYLTIACTDTVPGWTSLIKCSYITQNVKTANFYSAHRLKRERTSEMIFKNTNWTLKMCNLSSGNAMWTLPSFVPRLAFENSKCSFDSFEKGSRVLSDPRADFRPRKCPPEMKNSSQEYRRSNASTSSDRNMAIALINHRTNWLKAFWERNWPSTASHPGSRLPPGRPKNPALLCRSLADDRCVFSFQAAAEGKGNPLSNGKRDEFWEGEPHLGGSSRSSFHVQLSSAIRDMQCMKRMFSLIYISESQSFECSADEPEFPTTP